MGATWVRLRCRQSGDEFLHINTHLEDGSAGATSRYESCRLIATRAEEDRSGPALLIDRRL